MAGDALSFTIGLGLSGNDAVAGVQNVRDQLRKALDEFKSSLRSIDAFGKLTTELGNTSKAIQDVTGRIAGLKASLDQTGSARAFKQLNADLAATQTEFAALTGKQEQERAALAALTGDLSRTSAGLARVGAEVTTLQQALANAQRGTNTFKQLNADLIVTEKAFTALAEQEATQRAALDAVNASLRGTESSLALVGAQVTKFQAALAKSGDLTSIKAVEKELSAAEREFAALTAQQERQQKTLATLDASLASAGVNTRDLAAAERALAASASEAAEAIALQEAKQRLGLVTARDTQAQIQALRNDYRLLAESGTLTYSELAQAQSAFATRSAELTSANGTLAGSLKSVALELIGLYVVFQQLTSVLGASIRASADFGLRIAEVESIAQTSKAAINQLSEQVRALSRDVGVDAIDAVRGLYDIVSSGIPADNAFNVLAQSSKAAIAGLSDLQTTAKLGVQALNAFNLPASQLGGIFDKLFLTVRDGVVRFDELSHVFGNLFPAARATGTSLDDLGASLIVLTRKGLEAPEAVTALNQAISHLAAPTAEARAAMQDLGIVYNGFIPTVQQLAEKNLSLQQMRTLIPDIRAAKGLLSLSQSMELLNTEIKVLGSETGAVEKAYKIIADTPEFRLRRLSQAFEDLKRNIGDYLNSNGGLVSALTATINSFNTLDPTARSAVVQVGAFGTAALVAAAAVRILAPIISTLNATLATAGLSLARAAALVVTFEGAFAGGQKLYEYSGAVRAVGDSIGTLAGKAVESGLSFQTFKNLLALATGDLAAFNAAVAQDRDTLADLGLAARGVTGELRLLEAKQADLRNQIQQTTLAAQAQISGLREAVGFVSSKTSSELERIHTTIGNLTNDLSTLAGDFKALATEVKSSLDTALANVDAQTTSIINSIKLQQSAAGAARISELEALRLEAKVYADAATEKIKILRDAQVQAIALFEKEATARIAKAIETGQNLKRVERDLALERLAVYQANAAELQKVLDGQIAREQARSQASKTIIEDRKLFEIHAQQELTNLYREGLDPFRAAMDIRLEIDKLYFGARQALFNKDFKSFDAYVSAINGLIKQEAQEVKNGEEVIVSKSAAIGIATLDQQRINDLVRQSFDVKSKAIEKDQETERAAITETKKALEGVREIVTDLAKEAQKKIAILIEFDDAKFKKDLLALDVAIEGRNRLMPIDAETHAIDAKIGELANKISTGATYKIKDNLDEVRGRIDVLQKDLSGEQGLAGNFAAANRKLDELASSSAKLDGLDAALRSTSSQVAEINKQFADLAAPITKEIRVRVVSDATGAPIAAPVPGIPDFPGFASGGPVAMDSGVVPGHGHSDTVARMLRAGSFVINRGASDYYGQSMLGRMAHFASGGPVGQTQQQIDSGSIEFKRYQGLGFSSNDAFVNPQSADLGAPKLPTDQAELSALAYKYMAEVRSYALGSYSFWAPSLNFLADAQKRYERTHTSSDLFIMLNAARSIGLNLGLEQARERTAGIHTPRQMLGFDVDGRRFRFEGYKKISGQGDLVADWSFYGAGGDVAGGIPFLAEFTRGQEAIDPKSGPITSPTLPTDPNELRAMVYRYATQVRSFASADYGYWAPKLKDLDSAQTSYESSPNGASLSAMLDAARAIGLNLGINSAPRKFTGFDVDGRTFRFNGLSMPPGFAQPADSWSFYAGGGAAKGGDTVPAMLTPQEFVFSPQTVANYGVDFMQALNQRLISRDALAYAMGGKVQHFAEGGYVASDMYSSLSTSLRPVPAAATLASVAGERSSAASPIHLTLNVYGAGNDQTWIDRTLVPALRNVQRRSGN